MKFKLHHAPFLLGLMTISCFAGETQIAKGIVYHDINRNQTHDNNEKGIEGVLVSNGTDIVATNANGEYQLQVTDDTILFVIQPKGWEVPANELNLPQFYYIHKPAGSPTTLKYKGVDPTGPLPTSVDFPLHSSEVDDTFSIFAFGDPQPKTAKDVDYFKRDIIEEARLDKEPIAGVSLGDIVSDDLDLFDLVNRETALMDRPWWNVYGNHDMNLTATDPEMADETWEAKYGPATYAFQIGDVVFIVLDNVLFPNNYTQAQYTGGFTKKQLTFVENLLAHVPSENLVVTMFHIPLFEEYGDSFVDEHKDTFFQLFKNHKHTLSLSAHTHRQNHTFFDAEHDHWPHIDAPHHHYNVGTTSGSWWGGPKDERGIPSTTMADGTPNGWAILKFEGNQYIVDYHAANDPKGKVMSVYVPQAVRKSNGWSNAYVGINVYNGSEKTKVEYRVNNGKWKSALHSEAFDPQYAYERLLLDKTNHPGEESLLPYPAVSTHQWFGRLPIHLEPGNQHVDIRVTDLFGRVFEESTTYKIVE